MDQEDPEKHIAQMERELAEQKHVVRPCAYIFRPPEHMTEHPPDRHPPPGEGYPPESTVKIRPNLFLFWTPRWRDWRTDIPTGPDDPGTGNFFFDTFIWERLWDILWNRLWVVWSAILWVLEVCVAVVLAPAAVLTSVLGVPRHRLVAVSEDGGAQHLSDRGSWYAMRGARARARAQLARR